MKKSRNNQKLWAYVKDGKVVWSKGGTMGKGLAVFGSRSQARKNKSYVPEGAKLVRYSS